MLSSPNCPAKKALSTLKKIREGLQGTKNLVRRERGKKGKVKAVKISK